MPQANTSGLLLAILGPTASGKSALAIEIAREYNGEIISIDSRQVYRGMDIGTGKVERDENFPSLSEVGGQYFSEDIPHHLIDITDPAGPYNVTDFLRDATRALEDIRARGRLPILCGGTGFWAQALIGGQSFPSVPPDPEFRTSLSGLSAEELFSRLQAVNLERSRIIDRHNPVRLIRALEIAKAESAVTHELNHNSTPPTTGRVGLPLIEERGHSAQVLHNPDVLLSHATIIVLNPPIEILRDRIKKRLDARFAQGMIDEVQQLHAHGLSWERLDSFGLEYRWIARFLQNKLDEPTMRDKLYYDIVHYAKRQLTWFRRWERQGAPLRWVTSSDEAIAIVNGFG